MQFIKIENVSIKITIETKDKQKNILIETTDGFKKSIPLPEDLCKLQIKDCNLARQVINMILKD